MPVDRRKKPRSFRLSSEAISLADQLASKLGVTRTAVVEMSLRLMAKKEELADKSNSSTS